MKKVSILALLGLLLCSSAYADMLSVKITSFRGIDTTGHLAETCGQVTIDPSAPIPQTGNYIAVTVSADPGHDPGQYTMLADPNGAFCVVVATNYGEVEATAWLPSAATSAKSGVVKMTSKK